MEIKDKEDLGLKVKVLATKSNDLTLIPRPHMVEGET